MLITEAAPQGADHDHKFKIGVRCCTCRGANVSRDAAARWSDADQRWELSSVQDQGYCDDCDAGETKLVERHLDMEGKDAGPVGKWDRYDDEPEVEAKTYEPRELATILAALRFWQSTALAYVHLADGSSTQLEGKISTDMGRLKPLSRDEIDSLCNRLNQ